MLLQNSYEYLQIGFISIIVYFFKYYSLLILSVIYIIYLYKNNINFKNFKYSTPESGDLLLFYNKNSNLFDFTDINILNLIPTLGDKIFWDMGLLQLFAKIPYYHIGIVINKDLYIDDRIVNTFNIVTNKKTKGAGIRKIKEIESYFKRKCTILILKTNFKFTNLEIQHIYNDCRNNHYVGCVKFIMDILKKYNKINKNDKCIYPCDLIKYGYKMGLLNI